MLSIFWNFGTNFLIHKVKQTYFTSSEQKNILTLIPYALIFIRPTFKEYLPFWSYTPLKKSEWNLVSKISRKVFELGAWNLFSW